MLAPTTAMLIGIVVMMTLIIFVKLHAFPSLIISAILIAALAMPFGPEGAEVVTLSQCVSTVTGGFGSTMSGIGVVIGFGCMMGIFLERSGAAKRIALTVLKLVGVKNCDIVLGLTGLVVSIPVFCDSGFVILSSLAKEFSRLTKRSMVGLGGILGMGLCITHHIVPPTPGPLAVVSTFQRNGLAIDLGTFIICGLLISIPLFVFAVVLFRHFGKKYPGLVAASELDRTKYTSAQLAVLDRIAEKHGRGEELSTDDFSELIAAEDLPGAGVSFAVLLVPIVLIFLNTIGGQIPSLNGTAAAAAASFLGQPVVALFVSLCLGAFVLGGALGRKDRVDLMEQACRDAGPIIFITAAGGALGAVINSTGAAKMMADGIVSMGIPGVLVPIIIGAVMRFPQGSGTVAMITGSAIIAPMIDTLGVDPYIAALSLCLTSMCPSFLNDSYFHVVTNFSGMDISTSLKTWTAATILVPAFGSAMFVVLSILVG